MKSRKYYKQKIRKALDERGLLKNYRPTEAVVARWYHILNKSLFENKLKIVPIEVKRLKNTLGQVILTWDGRKSRKYSGKKLPYHNPSLQYRIEMNHQFTNWRSFLETLAHEMIHQYQVEIQKDPYANHNKNFYAWREKFARYKLNLCSTG